VAADEYLGLDVGQKRTGIARASRVARLAQPLKIVETEKLMDELQELAANNVRAIVVGLPRNLDGDDTAQTKWVRQWAQQAQAVIKLPFHLQDEALTTHQALERKPSNSHPDAEAAAIILQDFLNDQED
jgi:putative Holliday junction resolvase